MVEKYKLYQGDCLKVLPTLDANSIDSIITDPPYGYKFMGKDWDHGIPGEHFWREILQVAKPGAYLAAFGGPRTFHRLMCAIEDAGWEIRDTIMWVHSQGFPKSLSIGKAIDKLQGNEREIVGKKKGTYADIRRDTETGQDGLHGGKAAKDRDRIEIFETVGNSAWEGWGTALKPSWEPIIIARKPIEGTVVENVLKYGTGGLNIDECRVGFEERAYGIKGGENANKLARPNGNDADDAKGCGAFSIGVKQTTIGEKTVIGRFPANLILSYPENEYRMKEDITVEQKQKVLSWIHENA